jgi:hypothetical protein
MCSQRDEDIRRQVTPHRALAAALLCALVFGPAAAAAATPKVVATGLSNPRKISVGPDGSLYVVEAGTGGNVGSHRCVTTCVGETGTVVRIDHAHATRIVTGLGSLAVPSGQAAQGPAAVLFRHGTYYLLMQDMEIAAKGVNRVGLPNAGDLITTRAGKVSPKVVADFAAFEAAHNPDRGVGPGPKHGQPSIDSDPYDFVAYRGGFAVADAAANDLLWLSPSGRISVLAVFPVQHEKLTAAQKTWLGPPLFDPWPAQSVPTSVAVGPDGALYVGELTGWPYDVGKARIWRVVPGRKPTIYATGFTTISGLAFDGNDLLVLELASKGLLDPSSPGALIRLRPNGSRTVLASAGLVAPTGLAVAGGAIYISNYGTYPGSGAEPHGEIVSIPTR